MNAGIRMGEETAVAVTTAYPEGRRRVKPLTTWMGKQKGDDQKYTT